MKIEVCGNCKHGEYHGYLPLNESQKDAVSTVYFWCPINNHHNSVQNACDKFNSGDPKFFDKYGIQLYVHDWHRPLENNPYVAEVCTSIPPKYKYICSKCGKVEFVNLSESPKYFGCTK